MNITTIVQDGKIFKVTKEPTWFEKLIGKVKTIENYKDAGQVYENFEDVRVYISQKGKIMGATHEITQALECWRRRF